MNSSVFRPIDSKKMRMDNREMGNEVIDLQCFSIVLNENRRAGESYSESEIYAMIGEELRKDPYFNTALDVWNVYPGLLWRYIQSLGEHRVRCTIQEVGRKSGIARKGPYLRRCLASMVE